MNKICPACGSRNLKYLRKDNPAISPVIMLALGGVLFSMIYGSSRPWIVKCEDCGEVFTKHTFRLNY